MTRHTLPNGARLLVAETPGSEATVLGGLLVGGAVHDPAGREGLARLTAAVAQRATESLSYDAIYDRLDTLAASLSLGAGTHAISFHAKCLARHWGDVAELVVSLLRQPSFPPSEVQQARGEILTALREDEDSTRAVAVRELGHLVYPEGHPYRQPSQGTVAGVQAITREALLACHARLFRPDALILALVGRVEPRPALDRLGELLTDWARPAEPLATPSLAAAPLPAARRRDVPMADKSQADVALGCKSIPRSHPDFYALNQATHILGGMGLMGRLGENVRDRQGLAYYAFARMPESFGDGLWTARAGVNPAHVERTLASILDEVRRLQDEPVTEEELADCHDHLVGSLPVRLETNDGLAAALGGIELHGLGPDYIERTPAIIRSVTREAIQRAAQAHLTAERHAVAVAGPAAGTGDS